MHPVERYLAELRDLHLSGAGVAETSGYPALKGLLDEVGKRLLTPEEARYVTEMVRRIAAIIALGPALDENYVRVKADTYGWPRE
ncbi:MAG TPA: hypothetical protein VGA42_05090 [Gemmatimonadales bacterium]